MTVVFRVLLLYGTLFSALGSYSWAVDEVDLRGLIRKVEQQYTGQSSIATMEMTIITGHWQRHLKMDSWSLGRERFLVRIVEPIKEKGVATLKVENDVWNYLPKVDRVIRVPPSMMGGSWMGSHITNDDLVKANKIDEDYEFSLLSEDEQIWLIEARPRPEAAVIWGKIIYRISRDLLVPQYIEYFDEEDILVRRLVFDDVQTINGRHVPLQMTVLPVEKPEERTVVRYHNLQFDIGLSPRFFSLGRLKGGR